ncbi:PREDICTED: poly [ADP-ribose] polymerase 1-like isoform X1 [Nicotiana attenuata]|uniref:poly [ADP-ribose] polymerase 1-like isoform X1 n=1 Tax=Nicotiana attenuata TaxID=49451 RepID=UPI000904D2E6|nr:PREDICTED: poly [ADP-ribose] polymerase 1-like isoform X1 [Nicotiana attenuata]
MCAHAHKYRHIIEDGTRLTFENIPYQYFLVMNDDLIGNYQKTDDSTGTSSHCFGQIYSIEENPTRYVFYKWEQVYNKEMQYFYDYSSAVEAIERFEEQFLHATGNPWKSWIEKDFVRIASRFFPLEMDYYSRLRYRSQKKVDEIHEEIAVKLEHLKKLKINEKEITEVSIQKAQNITVRIVMEAHDILEGFKKLEVQGTHQKMVSAVKNQLKFLDDEEDLKFCSIVSRLLTSPVGTTIRLVDLPQKFDFFQPIGKILSVFFDYQKLQQKCLPPPPDLPHQIWPSSARELTQQYMLDKIRGVIGSWIMTLFFSPNEQMHHYYVKQKD